jgi:hypothetical protein
LTVGGKKSKLIDIANGVTKRTVATAQISHQIQRRAIGDIAVCSQNVHDLQETASVVALLESQF